MIEIFEPADYSYSAAKRVRNWWIFAGVIVLLAALNIPLLLFRHQIGRGLARFLNIIITAAACGGLLFWFKMRFRPVAKYARMLREINKGLIEKDKGQFLMFEDTITDKEGVEFYIMIVEERVKKRPDMPERRILIPTVKPRPEVKPGDVIKYETQAGILIRYEVVGRVEPVEAGCAEG